MSLITTLYFGSSTAASKPFQAPFPSTFQKKVHKSGTVFHVFQLPSIWTAPPRILSPKITDSRPQARMHMTHNVAENIIVK